MAPFKHLRLARYRFSSTFYGNACGKNLSRVSTWAILAALEPQRFSRQLRGDVVLLYYVTGHSCCGVPANVLSFCLSVCLFVCFFFGEANKIKIKNISSRILQFLVFSGK